MFVSYNVETGELISTSDQPITISGHPLQVKECDITYPVSFDNYEWVPNIANFVQLRRSGLSKLQYMNRFTDEELVTIYSVAKSNVAIEVWLAKFNASTPDESGNSIYLDDPNTIRGIYALEHFGLIGEGRASEILNG